MMDKKLRKLTADNSTGILNCLTNSFLKSFADYATPQWRTCAWHTAVCKMVDEFACSYLSTKREKTIDHHNPDDGRRLSVNNHPVWQPPAFTCTYAVPAHTGTCWAFSPIVPLTLL